MNQFWSRRIREIEPYTPGEQPRDRVLIKLNTNENPYPPSGRATAALRAAADADLRLYPDPTCLALRRTLARHYGLSVEQVFAGNGSDEVLSFCFQAFFEPDRAVSFADITYSFYQVYVDFNGLSSRIVPLDERFDLPVDALLGCPGGVVLANPNAPTGKAIPLGDVEAIVRANPDHVVLVDEAYVDFGGESAVPLIGRYPNLIVVHTLSKSRSLAGLRVGFAMGDAGLIEGLCRVRDSINSYPVGRLAQAGAAAAIEDEAHFAQTVGQIVKTRGWVTERLRALGFLVHRSSANFVLIRHDRVPAKALLAGLRAAGILVRHFDRARIDDHLRVSIGTDAEMEIFCKTVERLLTGQI